MSKKNVILAMLSFIFALAIMIIPNKVSAVTTLTPPVYFGVNEFRGTNFGYAIGNPYANKDINSIVGTKIWQIVKYNGPTDTNPNTGNYYCVRAGVGFSDTDLRAEYNIAYDLKNDKALLEASSNKYLQKIATNGYYNNLLALSDLLYLKGVSTDAEKTSLLNSAGIYAEDYTALMTDDDIEAVQQAAVWYYSNHDDVNFEKVYNNLGEDKTSWLFYRTLEMSQQGKTYTSLSDYKLTFNNEGKKVGEGKQRQEQAVMLYNYLINTANKNASTYENGTANTITKITLYSNATIEETQPIVLIERKPETREFDLALRKYITKVDGTVLEQANSRVPNIDVSTIETNKTATYKHKKDPIVIKTGSIVTYNLTVYNEGEKAGRATKIVDQLPTGLKSKLTTGSKVTSTKGNEYTVTYNETTNRIEFQTSGTNNLIEFTGTNLDSDTIQIDAEVVAKANTKSDIILTNVAWISEEYDAVTKEVITNEKGKDRDSEPSTTPSVNKDNMSNYIGNGNKEDLTDSNYYYKGQQDDDDFEKLKINKEQEGSYNLILIKEDANGKQLNSQATFEVNGQTKNVVGKLQVATDVKITSENVNKADSYVIKETVAPDKYCQFDGIINVMVTKKIENNAYKVDKVSYKVTDKNGKDITDITKGKTNVYLKDGNIYVEVKNYQFDLKLVKRIVEVNGTKVPERIESIDITKLANGTETTADYKLNKNPVAVKKGDIVKYTLRIYNEGEVDGYASEISEDVPEGLEFIWSEKDSTELEADTTLTRQEKDAIKYNQGIWDIKTVNKDTKRVELITTDYLAKGKGAEIKNDGANLLKAFDSTKEYKNVVNEKNPDYREVSVFMKVVAENSTKGIIRNEAAITEDTDKDGRTIDDRDSDPKKWVKYEDDEDYDNVIVQTFDIALRKFIVAVGKNETINENDYLKNSNGIYNRAPIVDTSKLNTIGEDGKIITTATYNHTKQPVEVVKGDYVVYMLRAYNESDLNGYASEIKDYLPPYLKFVDGEFNKKYGWTVSEDGRTVTTKYLDNHMISKTSTNQNGQIVLSYKEVPIMCKVTNNAQGKITNIAEITEYKDENKKPIEDRDSQPKNVKLPSDKDLPNYQDDKTGSYIPGQQDDDDFEKLKINKEQEGSYNLILIKEDANGKQLNSQATFEVNGQTKNVVGKLQVATDVKITSENVNKADSYVIKETVAPDKYCQFDGIINVMVTKKIENNAYKVDKVSYKVTDKNGKDITDITKGKTNVYLKDGNIYVEVKNYQFDLKLVKRIVEVNGTKVPERIESIDITKLANGTETTADYKLNKNPVAVKKGDIVKYTLRIYNEGEVDGYASEISEDVPEGLEFIWSEKDSTELEADTTLTRQEKDAIKYNQGIWDIKTVNKDTKRVELITTDYLAKGKGAEIKNDGANLLKAFDSTKEYKNVVNEKNPDYREVSVFMKVVAENSTKGIIRNEAAITEDTDKDGRTIDDRDSDPKKWVKYEDDEDYDNVIVQTFDIALRKFIVAVGKNETINENDYLKNSNGIYNRAPIVDTSKLNTIGEDGKIITTATYNHTKQPVEVVKGDYVVYMLRAYNESDLNGYASEIKDYLPPYLKFVDGEFNKKYGWTVSEDGRTVTTKYLDNHMISKTSTNQNGQIVLSYKEVPIMCKVTNNAQGKITNIAEITEYKDENKKPIEDRDSQPKNVKLPSDKDLPNYQDDKTGSYIPGQQDDDDFEKLIVKKFDLALRKFITAVNDKKVTTRIPQVKYDKSKNQITYEHTKKPVEVANSDIVTYTIRIFNEGELNGYANKVSDDIPEGLEYLPENNLNKEYRWVMYDKDGKETKNVSEVVKITTDYLSKEQGEARKTSNDKENPALLKAFDGNKAINDENPDYADVKVAFRVIEPNNSKKILVNSAQISDDTDENGNPIDDEDSTTDKWIDGEDDQDREYVKLKIFDLALRKFITGVNENAVTNRIPVAKYDSSKNQITYEHTKEPVEVETDDIVIYTIRIFNEGEVDGFANKVRDDLPEGLEYLPSHEINKEYRWVMYDKDGKETNNVSDADRIITDYLSKEQGEARMKQDDKENPALLSAFDGKNLDYADVKVAFKIVEPNNSKKILVNSAQISDDTDKGGKPVDDIDSTTDKWIDGEDDQDREYVKLKTFDLALRKFITGVNDQKITTRIPQVKYDKENNKISYEHTKEPVNVVTDNIVTYTIRVFNEGQVDGYASRVSDDMPKGLEFLPNNELNKQYRWVMYDKDGKETDKVEDAVKLTTDYLSKEQGEVRMKDNSELKENPALLKAFDPNKEINDENPDYADVEVAFKVVAPNTSDKIIINSAQITDDTNKNGNPVDDIDSTTDKWIDGEDDQDREYIKLNYFDLALRKWVTQAIVIEDGKETVTETGHKAEDNPEQVVKVELNRKKLDKLKVKFKYSIRVTNEGDIPGYAKEITDYVPEGLKFVAEDNADWKDEGNNVISTRKLENKLLQPGESAEVEVLLTWINGKDNLGLKTNIAEISEDYNDWHAHDIDSTPDNKVPGEDDIDDAPVLLSISTGEARVYFALGLTVLITIAGGIILIRKYVM